MGENYIYMSKVDKKKEEEVTNWSTEVRKVFWPIE